MTETTFVLEPLPPLQELERLWRGFDRTGAHSFFVTWTWMGTLLRAMPAPPLLLKAMRGAEIAGLALLTPREGRLRGIIPVRQAWFNAAGDPVLDGVMIEHNGFALPSTPDPALMPALVDWFATSGDAADEMILPGVAPGAADAGVSLLLIESRKHGYRAPLDKGAIETLISRNARQQLRRSMRESPPSLDAASDTATALEYFAGLKELHIRSWKRRGRRHAFDNPFFETFHRALIAAGTKDGNIDLLRIRAGARTLGYLYNFRRNGIVSNYQSGFDDENPGLRPGYVCHAAAIAHYAAAGARHYDFLAGANRLKETFGIEKYDLSWRHYRRRTFGFRAEELVRKAARLIRREAPPKA